MNSDETATPAPESAPVKRPRGRPRKHPLIEREPQREPITSNRYQMRARPNWESVDPQAEDTPDRLRLPDGAIPPGMTAQWVTDSVLGQSVPTHRAAFERKGWTPVHQDDFDGRLDGAFMPRGAQGEINVDGLVLMVRPKEFSDRAARTDAVRAKEAVAIREQAWRNGDLPSVTLDTQHPTAIKSNRISKTMERIEIPSDDRN